jgi:uncharacterized protein (UPF0332 family)
LNSKHKDEITANLERAEKSISAAKKLASDKYYDFAASRAYYSVFYAATALLLTHDLEFRKHSGVIASLHQNFIKTGKLNKEFGKDLNWLFELRGIADYGVSIHVPKQEAEKAIDVAERFVEAVKKFITSLK